MRERTPGRTGTGIFPVTLGCGTFGGVGSSRRAEHLRLARESPGAGPSETELPEFGSRFAEPGPDRGPD